MSLPQEYVLAIAELPKSEQAQANALGIYLQKWLNAEKQLEDQIQKMSADHLKNTLPIQNPISEIITGQRFPNQNELIDGERLFTNEEREQLKSLKPGPIQNYWQKVFQNFSDKSELLTEDDGKVFQYLRNVIAILGENERDFKIRFEFEENEYFGNKILEKEFIFHTEQELPYKCNSTEINWKQGKNVTKKISKKKQRNKKTNQTRIIESEIDVPSFFHFFREIKPVAADEDEPKFEEEMEQDLSLGEAILEDVIPDSLAYYLGLKHGQGDDGIDEEDDDDDEDNDDDEDDDDDNE